MKIVTVINNTENYNFNLLRLSCVVNGLELVALVSNNDFTSRRTKDEMLEAYLDEVPEDEVILFTDGFDALMLCSEDEIYSKFEQFNCDLVFSAETQCWPDKSLAAYYPPTQSIYKYLNSGGFIGKVGAMKRFYDLKAVDEQYPNSNQYLWAKWYLKNRDTVKLDTSCEIFCTFSPEIGTAYLSKDNPRDYTEYYDFMKDWFNDNFKIENLRIQHLRMNTQPCHAHFNGNSKVLIDDELVNIIYTKIPSYIPTTFYYE